MTMTSLMDEETGPTKRCRRTIFCCRLYCLKMTQLQLSFVTLLIFCSSSAMSETHSVDWQKLLMSKHKHAELLWMTTNCTLNFECGSPLLMNYSGTVDIYSVDHEGYKTCDATHGKITSSLKCGEHHANKAIRALDFIKKDIETYYFIGFARMKTKPKKPVLVGGTCKSLKSKLKIHICALARKSHGKVCTMKLLPKVLASKQTKQKDKEEKPKGSLKTFYISMIIVGILGVLIALAMCIFQPLKSQQVSGQRNVSNRKSNKDTAFQRLHDKYRVEDMEEGNK